MIKDKMQLKLKVNNEYKLQQLVEITEQTKSFELSHQHTNQGIVSQNINTISNKEIG